MLKLQHRASLKSTKGAFKRIQFNQEVQINNCSNSKQQKYNVCMLITDTLITSLTWKTFP